MKKESFVKVAIYKGSKRLTVLNISESLKPYIDKIIKADIIDFASHNNYDDNDLSYSILQ